jgi:8-oxo-dGTP pyrophosphatase MutT (NUDIX family)
MARTRVAAVILYREHKVLLQQRDDRPGIASPGMWCCFGGHIEDEEDPEFAARREIEEETGFRIEGPLESVLHEAAESRDLHFFAAPLTVPMERLQLGEGQAMKLVDPVDFPDYPIVASHLKALKSFIDSR